MGKAKWITIIIISFLLSACTSNVSISLEGSLPPLPTVSIDGNEVNVYRGGYCWYECTDDESIVEKVKNKKHSQVAKNSPIYIGFASELKPDRVILLSKGQGESALSEHPLKVPDKPGKYTLVIRAFWEGEIEADAEYGLVLEVK